MWTSYFVSAQVSHNEVRDSLNELVGFFGFFFDLCSNQCRTIKQKWTKSMLYFILRFHVATLLTTVSIWPVLQPKQSAQQNKIIQKQHCSVTRILSQNLYLGSIHCLTPLWPQTTHFISLVFSVFSGKIMNNRSKRSYIPIEHIDSSTSESVDTSL